MMSPLEMEVAGDLIEGLRCPNCGDAEVTAGIVLVHQRDGVSTPEIGQQCHGCGQQGCDQA